MSDNGEHDDDEEEGGLLAGEAGELTEVEGVQFGRGMVENLGPRYSGIRTPTTESLKELLAILFLQVAEGLLADFSTGAINAINDGYFGVGGQNAWSDLGKLAQEEEPPVGIMLYGGPPSPSFAALGSTGSGQVALGAFLDPLFSFPVAGADVPSVYRVGFKNLTSVTQTFMVDANNLPAGFTICQSVPGLTLSPGQTGEISVALMPSTSAPLPSPGTQVPFTLTVVSTTDSTVRASQNLTFTVPTIDAVSLSASPAAVGSTPGTPASTMTLVNSGNVPETVNLAAAVPTGLTASGLTTLTIPAGQSATEILTLTPSATATLNTTLSATITASFGSPSSPQTATAEVDLSVRSAQVVALQQAAGAASGGPDTQLATNLSELTDALVQLQTTPTDPAALSRVQFLLNNLGPLLQADPALASFVATVQPIQADALAGNVTGLLALTSPFFSSLAPTLTQEADQQFTIALSPAQIDLEPGVGKTFSVQLTNTGPDSETLALGVGSLPANVSAVLGQTQVTLAPGASISVPLTMSDSLVSATLFNLQVTATETLVKQTTTAIVSVEPAEADVLGVTVSPSTPAAGAAVSVTALVFNTANVDRNVLAKVDLLDGSGNLLSTLEHVPVALVPGATPRYREPGTGRDDRAGRRDLRRPRVVGRGRRHGGARPDVSGRLRGRSANHRLGHGEPEVCATRDVDGDDDDQRHQPVACHRDHHGRFERDRAGFLRPVPERKCPSVRPLRLSTVPAGRPLIVPTLPLPQAPSSPSTSQARSTSAVVRRQTLQDGSGSFVGHNGGGSEWDFRHHCSRRRTARRLPRAGPAEPLDCAEHTRLQLHRSCPGWVELPVTGPAAPATVRHR